MRGSVLGGAKHRGARTDRSVRLGLRTFMRRATAGLQRQSRFAGLFEILSVIGALAAIWIGVAIGLSHERSVDEQRALGATRDLASAVEESTEQTVSDIDNLLRSARAVRLAQGGAFVLQAWAKTQIAFDRSAAQISMADGRGNVTGSTVAVSGKPNIAEQPQFYTQLDPTRDDLYISHPAVDPLSGKRTIQFSRKLFDTDGRFDGVIVYALGEAELLRAYETVDLHGGYMALLSTDGTALARGPAVPGIVGTRIVDPATLDWMLGERSGSTWIRDSGATSEFVSYRALQGYKLLGVVAFDADYLMNEYRALRRHALIGGFVASLVVCLVGMWWIADKQANRRASRAMNIALSTIDQGVLVLNRHGNVEALNSPALQILGFPGGQSDPDLSAVAAQAAELMSQENASASATQLPSIYTEQEAPSGEVLETVSDDGRAIKVRRHLLPGGERVYTYSDVTDQRQAEQRVNFVELHDALTGLANRQQLTIRLADLLSAAVGTKSLIAVLLLNIDGFKRVNDSLGHKVADELLVEIGRRLPGALRESDIVARLGADEFAIVLPGLNGADEVVPVAQRILNQFATPVAIGERQVSVSSCIGVSFYPNDGSDVETLCKAADIALCAAKSDGRGSFALFDPSQARAVNDRRDLETDLRRALLEETLEVYFQPKFDCSTLRIVGAEALLRWKHPERGFIPPPVFISLAEECGLIKPLGLWVLKHVCTAAASWRRSLPVAVNVSVPQLRDPEFRAEVASILAKTGISSKKLELEVTESVMADDDPAVMENLQAFKAMGLTISLDDFGTGYSSLSYLRRFSFDKIKIDKSFVQSMVSDAGVRVIVDAMLSMCHNLGLITVAEGVETIQQLVMLQERGCAQVQGFLLAKPMPEAMIEAFINESGPSALTGLLQE